MANQTRQLAELLEREGVRVDLVQVNAPYRPRWIEALRGVRALFRLLPYLWRLWVATGRSDLMHLMANSGWSWHLFAAPALLVANWRGLPVVVNYRGGEAGPFLRKQGRFVLPLLKRAKVAVPSGFLAELFESHGLQSTIVPNIVDLDRFRECGGNRPSSTEELHVVVTRNLEAIYDISTALKAFARIRIQWPGARLTIAGSGPKRQQLEAEAEDLGLGTSVCFAGRLEREAMAQLYSSAHVMLNPSRVDNTPNSVLEAWASGVAVVSTRVGGVPYLVREGVDAILVPPADAEAMASAVLDLLAAPDRLAALVAAGRQAAERFSWARVGPRWLALYRELCGHGEEDVLGGNRPS